MITKIDYRPCQEKVSDRVVVLVNDHRRLEDEVHDRVIKKWQEWLPYDMYIHQHDEREEYQLISRYNIQHMKHWWSLKKLPTEVKYVIRVRNDALYDDRFTAGMVDFFKMVENYCEKEEMVSVGFGTINHHKHFGNIQRGTLSLGDFVLFHPIECYQNPYDHFDLLKKISNAHLIWGSLLKGKKYQIDWHPNQVFR